jgi:hypothetical protein
MNVIGSFGVLLIVGDTVFGDLASSVSLSPFWNMDFFLVF